LDVLHSIVDCKPSGHATARRIDIEIYLFLWILGLEEEQLCDNTGGGDLINLAVETDDAFFKQARKDVLGLPTASLTGQRD